MEGGRETKGFISRILLFEPWQLCMKVYVCPSVCHRTLLSQQLNVLANVINGLLWTGWLSMTLRMVGVDE